MDILFVSYVDLVTYFSEFYCQGLHLSCVFRLECANKLLVLYLCLLLPFKNVFVYTG